MGGPGETSDMAQLVSGERTLFRSLAGSPDLDMEDAEATRTLGTVKGVFSPVTLSMFSALLFLRLGYILGNAGLIETILLFGLAYTILVATVFSICAIATNGAVKTGGVYFMLSRTMGPEFGGAVGFLFYFANIVGSALYVTACVEGFLSSFGQDDGTFIQEGGWGFPQGVWWSFLYCSVFNILNLCLCMIGAAVFGKFSLMILSVIGVCCAGVTVSFFLDTSYTISYNVTSASENSSEMVYGHFYGLSYSNISTLSSLWHSNLYPSYAQDCENPEAKVDFFTVFGVLFSGVTGIMAGANLSGDLKAPSRNIPQGTLAACATTFITFLVLVVLTSVTCDPGLLLNDCMYMVQFTAWRPLVLVGVVLATWSASLSNMIGASRVLQAVAEDTIFGPFLSFINKGTINNNPIRY